METINEALQDAEQNIRSMIDSMAPHPSRRNAAAVDRPSSPHVQFRTPPASAHVRTAISEPQTSSTSSLGWKRTMLISIRHRLVKRIKALMESAAEPSSTEIQRLKGYIRSIDTHLGVKKLSIDHFTPSHTPRSTPHLRTMRRLPLSAVKDDETSDSDEEDLTTPRFQSLVSKILSGARTPRSQQQPHARDADVCVRSDAAAEKPAEVEASPATRAVMDAVRSTISRLDAAVPETLDFISPIKPLVTSSAASSSAATAVAARRPPPTVIANDDETQRSPAVVDLPPLEVPTPSPSGLQAVERTQPVRLSTGSDGWGNDLDRQFFESVFHHSQTLSGIPVDDREVSDTPRTTASEGGNEGLWTAFLAEPSPRPSTSDDSGSPTTEQTEAAMSFAAQPSSENSQFAASSAPPNVSKQSTDVSVQSATSSAASSNASETQSSTMTERRTTLRVELPPPPRDDDLKCLTDRPRGSRRSLSPRFEEEARSTQLDESKENRAAGGKVSRTMSVRTNKSKISALRQLIDRNATVHSAKSAPAGAPTMRTTQSTSTTKATSTASDVRGKRISREVMGYSAVPGRKPELKTPAKALRKPLRIDDVVRARVHDASWPDDVPYFQADFIDADDGVRGEDDPFFA